ncbi:phosphoribosylanthranilate isomerase [Anaerolineales bacterium HSG24]|nr:phosphoribosylanthranilate isomerase [Anaerolineales bacterium HSG24]
MIQIKICGLTNLEDAHVATEVGADLLGFIFYEPSPRYVTPDTVKQIVTELHQRESTARMVGVFVNATPETVRYTLDYCQLDLAQLHGEESPDFVAQFATQAYKALRPQSLADAETMMTPYLAIEADFQLSKADRPQFLIDAYHPILYGGTGHVTDWGMAATLANRYEIMLAGSLTPDNVAEAIEQVQPWGVDVSSGVERAKGQKEHDLVRAFVRAARGRRASSMC